jgi:hypothetical protein
MEGIFASIYFICFQALSTAYGVSPAPFVRWKCSLRCVHLFWGNFAEVSNISFGFLFFPVAYIISCQDALALWPSSGYGGHTSQHFISNAFVFSFCLSYSFCWMFLVCLVCTEVCPQSVLILMLANTFANKITLPLTFWLSIAILLVYICSIRLQWMGDSDALTDLMWFKLHGGSCCNSEYCTGLYRIIGNRKHRHGSDLNLPAKFHY